MSDPIDLDVLNTMPGEYDKWRACMRCALLKTFKQFLEEGCENCEEIMRFIGNPDNVYTCTSPTYSGTVALIDNKLSWAAKFLNIAEQALGVYAMNVTGTLPDHILDDMLQAGIPYRCHDQTVPSTSRESRELDAKKREKIRIRRLRKAEKERERQREIEAAVKDLRWVSVHEDLEMEERPKRVPRRVRTAEPGAPETATFSRSSGIFTRPRGAFSRPTATVTRPTATFTRPTASVTRPRGAFTRPTATVTRPEEALTRPEETAVSQTEGGTGLIETATTPSMPEPEWLEYEQTADGSYVLVVPEVIIEHEFSTEADDEDTEDTN